MACHVGLMGYVLNYTCDCRFFFFFFFFKFIIYLFIKWVGGNIKLTRV
jgi:hypothetical protein